jgi:hypothetical protein
MTFVYYLSLSFIAATLLASGSGHLFGFSGFRAVMQSHNVVRPGFTTLVAIVISVFELVAGSASLVALLSNGTTPLTALLFVLCAIAGCAFVWYIRQLLRNPTGIASCGCSPLTSPLTPASLVPATALLVVSAAGLATTSFGFDLPLHLSYERLSIAVALPLVWGVTLAMITMLLPASVPRLVAGGK